MGANPPNQSVRRDETIKAKKHVRETATTMTGSDYGEPPGSPGFGFDGDLNPDFPQDGFPAALAKFVCWDILGDKKINALNPCYIKGYQNWDYVPLNSKHAKFQMLVLTPPTSKPYDEFTIEFPGGHTTTSRWVSKVGNARAFNDFTIRGYAASWYVYAWLPLRSAVGMPPHVPGEAADQPPEHEELVQVVALPFSKEGFPLETTVRMPLENWASCQRLQRSARFWVKRRAMPAASTFPSRETQLTLYPAVKMLGWHCPR